MEKDRTILIFENSYSLTNHLYKKWNELAEESIKQRGRFVVALSGGRTPIEFYSKLASIENFDLWHKTHLFLADERFVPFEDAKSNFRMIRENLLNYIDIPQENIHPIETQHENVSIAAESYKEQLTNYFELNPEGFPRFDFILLGVGDDGHTASLFPDDPEVDDPNRLTLPVSLNHLKTERISLTVPVFNSARSIIFLVLGSRKADIMREIIEKGKLLPAAKVKATEGTIMFLLDREAAGKLSYKESFTHQGEAISI